MLTKNGQRFSIRYQSEATGVALIVTLSLLVLVTVAVVAFFSRTATNQQITSGSAQGALTDTFANGASDEIIAGLQREMFDVSGAVVQPNKPTILPMTSVQGSVPSRMVSSSIPSFPVGATPSPNATYAQFGNLVKQSINGVPTYSVGSKTGPKNASSVHTTSPAANGQTHDGVYWSQPRLISTADPNLLFNLVPDWIYTARSGQHPPVYAAGMAPSGNGALGPNSIVGRYAYNVYDIGGLLNANVAGYGGGNPFQPDPSVTGNDAKIIPAYKGSVLMADLSGLTLGGSLNPYGTSATAITNWRGNWQSALPNFRYPNIGTQNWSKDLAKLFASGQIGGWIQPYLAPYDPNISTVGTSNSVTSIVNNNFTSRQDLITWINSLANSDVSDGTPPTWVLPYLTHFSFDTDAPSFTPDSNRPRSNVTLGSTGGNDSSSSLDDSNNPAFPFVLDTNGYPRIKHRFPLSSLSLLDGIYPGHVPGDLLNAGSDLYKHIQYDFGLVWNTTYNCWDYKDLEGGTGAIKRIADQVPQTRSPNFFELLKATITAGSLGKEWGAGSFDGDPDNTLASPPGTPRYSATAYQIIQIGANIISQTTSHYCPTAICLFGNGQAPIIYGVKDLPYFYRTRLLTLYVDDFKQVGTRKPMYDKAKSAWSLLAAVMVQPELWNPHAPNLLSSTANYPIAFRIVPQTATAVGVATTSSSPGTQWQEYVPPTLPPASPIGDYTAMGGPYCLPNLAYNATPTPDAYISFGWDASHTDLLPKAPDPVTGSALGSFREPCPLAAPTFPPNINLDSFPKGPTMVVGYRVQWDGYPNTQIVSQIPATKQNVIPARFTTATPSNTALGFLVAYCCTGSGDLTQFKGMTGGPMLLNLQYSMDGTNFFTYDTIQSAFPDGQIAAAPPSGVQQSFTGVRTDPRTNRWGLIWAKIPYGQYIYGNGSYVPGQYDNQAGLSYSPSSNLGTTNYGTSGNKINISSPLDSLPKAPGWVGTLNTTTSPYALQMGWTQVNQSTAPGYYQDPDGVVRRADGAYVNTTSMTGASGSSANATGLPQAMLAQAGNSQSSAPGISGYDSRPVVLNRPFQSVAELGYAFRDTPWRSLDFFTPESGDNALLDVFCVYGPDPYSYMTTLTTETGLVAGKVNLNTRQLPVLAALLQSASTTTVFPSSTPSSPVTLTADQATKTAQSLVQWTTNTSDATQGPLRNLAELVGKYTGSGTTRYSGFSGTITSALSGTSSPPTPASIIKQQRESVMHALADAGTTRTWNLLIDLVAQTGQLTPNPAGLQSFVVNGERHVWVSVSLDRVTGKVIKMQVEPVRL